MTAALDAHVDYIRGIRATQVRVAIELLMRAEDRPVHRAYIETLLEAPDLDAALELEPPRPISGRYLEAIERDVEWIKRDALAIPVGSFVGAYPNAYDNRRVTDARAAADRARTRERETSLARMWGIVR